MKTLKFYALIGVMTLAMVFASCSKDEADETPFYSGTNGDSKELSNFEKAGLLSLLETQKLHRDVYVWMNHQVEKPVLTELAQRDGQFMERLSIKVDKYGLENPTVGLAAGEYKDASIQNQYNDFIRSGNFSWSQMVSYALQMEEAQISTICQYESALNGNTDIGKICEELRKESQFQLYELNLENKGWIQVLNRPVRDM